MNVEQFNKNCEERTLQMEELLEHTKQAIKRLDEKMNVDNKRIYSVNVASYLKSAGYEYSVHEDEEKSGLKYFVFKDDISNMLEKYKANIELQDFIRSYKKIKEQLHNN